MTEPYENLANAIIVQASRDWLGAIRNLNNPKKNARQMLTDCEPFFRSPWCDLLSGGLGEHILEKLKKEATDDKN